MQGRKRFDDEGARTMRVLMWERGERMEFDIVRQLGVTVIEVEGLPRLVSYVDDVGVVLVRAGLDHAMREHCARWLLSEVTRPATAPAT